MKKSKTSSKGTTKKSAKKRSHNAKKQVDLVEVRRDITQIMGSEAKEMAQAVVGEALKGQLAPVKYLFEVSGRALPCSCERGRRKELQQTELGEDGGRRGNEHCRRGAGRSAGEFVI